MTCPSTGLPRCARFSFGLETQTVRKVDCFEVHAEYFDFDGELFGESTEKVQIEVFRGPIDISSLPIYPLEFHLGCHYRQYQGNMFVLNQERLMKLHVSSRVMIDVKLFRRSNPNYPKFETQKISVIDIFSKTVESVSVDRIKSSGMDPRSMKERDKNHTL